MARSEDGHRAARTRALRMLAVQILGQLPENQTEAQMVLSFARDLLDNYLHVDVPDPKRGQPCEIMQMRRPAS